MKVINLFGGPGAGKSTTAAGLFHFMKLGQMSVELVTDHSRPMTWGRDHVLSDQLSMFARQHRRITQLKGMVDYVVTDAPLLLSAVYRDEKTPVVFEQMVVEFWSAFENCNFFLERTRPFARLGRRQSEEDARGIDARVLKVLGQYEVPFTTLPGDAEASGRILEVIKELHFRAAARSPKWTHSRTGESGIEAALGAVAADAEVPQVEPAPLALVSAEPEPEPEQEQVPLQEAPKPARKKRSKKK